MIYFHKCKIIFLIVMTFGIFSYFVPSHLFELNLTTRDTVTNADPQQNLYNVPEHTTFPEGEVCRHPDLLVDTC